MTVAQPQPLPRRSHDPRMATRKLLHALTELLGDRGPGRAHWPARQT
jgi:hypothetical protein